uniref:BED-type domain-containing protein n=1 Tax=Chenopodium quinoa TaxID=63459 RepID=A0A803MKY9_CHEQI
MELKKLRAHTPQISTCNRIVVTLFESTSCSCVVVVREKDVCWEYGDKLDGNKVRCKFCSRVLNGGISRLKHHLSRLPSKGVNPCSKVRDDVTDRVRAIIAAKDDIREIPVAKKPKLGETSSPGSILPNKPLLFVETSSPTLSQIDNSSSSSDEENAEESIALFFFENKLDFSVARSSSYQQMVEAIGKCGSGFSGPSAETLKTKWLERIKSKVNLGLKDTDNEWVRTGCTIIADTWTDNKSRAMVNFLVSSPSRTFFHKSVDVSSYYKNIKSLADLFDSVIQEIGPENVVQIIVDGALSYSVIVVVPVVKVVVVVVIVVDALVGVVAVALVGVVDVAVVVVVVVVVAAVVAAPVVVAVVVAAPVVVAAVAVFVCKDKTPTMVAL